MITPEKLAEMKEKADAATQGPWADPYYDNYPGDEGWWIHNGKIGMEEGAVAATFYLNRNGENDAQFIAHARSDVPALIAEVERLRARVERLELVLNRHGLLAEADATDIAMALEKTWEKEG